jgi:uncharacterized protein
MSDSHQRLATLSPDGHEISWSTWDGDHTETLNLTWDNEAWTAVGRVGRERVEYVLRLAPTWHVRQFLLFRDLDDPDLWLAIDAEHRWGEINGSYRTELDGCADVELACTPFTATVPIRRLKLAIGQQADLDVIDIDVETLATSRQPVRYERLSERTYQRTALRSGEVRRFEVDEFGLVVDEVERFRRSPG